MKIFLNGLFRENPVLVLLLGLCPALAITTNVQNAVGMGVSTALVLIASTVVISFGLRLVPGKIRSAVSVIVIAGFVAAAEMLLKAYFPILSEDLGIFVPLIAVNCVILNRVQGVTSESSAFKSVLGSIGTGLGFTAALVIVAAVREILGRGTFAGTPIFGANAQPAAMLISPPGAFLALALILAAINMLKDVKKVPTAESSGQAYGGE